MPTTPFSIDGSLAPGMSEVAPTYLSRSNRYRSVLPLIVKSLYSPPVLAQFDYTFTFRYGCGRLSCLLVWYNLRWFHPNKVGAVGFAAIYHIPTSIPDSGFGRERGERGRRRRRSPRAASAEHPLATVCNKLLQSMGALRADNATLSERLGALERQSSVADPSPLPLTPHPREVEDAAMEELSLEAPGDSFSEEELPHDWLPRDTEPMEVPRQHSEDTSAVLTTCATPTSEAQPSAEEPEWRRYRETLRAVYRYSLRAVPRAGPRGSLLLPASVGGADQRRPACKWRG